MRLLPVLLGLALVAGCCFSGASSPGPSLRDLRRTHTTRVAYEADPTPPDVPPPAVLELVRYRAPLGENHAYVTPAQAGARRPAIVWIHGGFDWGISGFFWAPQGRGNDQSGRAFREAGIVQMYPSLRGSNGNPGRNECFFGEVEDVIAAADFLATRPDVDPTRIYLGGHSTGATLALLVAESTDRFRGVIAFGPIDDPRGYGEMGCLPEDVSEHEARVRAPIEFVEQIRTPTVIVEGEVGNADAVANLARYRGDAPVDVVIVPGADHFTVLAPGTEAAAQAILADTGPTPRLAITVESVIARGIEEAGMDDEDMFLSTRTESDARAARVLPRGPSEDASHVLGVPPRPPGTTEPEAERDYGPDEALAWVVTLSLPESASVSRAQIAAVLDRDWRLAHGRPVLYGRSGGRWTYVQSADAPDSFDALKLGWDLVASDTGPTSADALQAWTRALEARARELAPGTRVSTSRAPSEAAARAVRLAAWREAWDVDVQVLLVAPERQTYEGVQLWDALTSVGLHWGDGDFFHWENPFPVGSGHVFSVGTTTPPGYFFPEEAVAGRLRVQDLDFGFAPARAHDPVAVFEAMMRGVRYVQGRLGGEILGPDGEPLDQDAMRQDIERLVEDMERAGIRPGSDTALRLL